MIKKGEFRAVKVEMHRNNISRTFKEVIDKYIEFIEIDDNLKFNKLKKFYEKDIEFEEDRDFIFYKYQLNELTKNKIKNLCFNLIDNENTHLELNRKEANGEIFCTSILINIIKQFRLEKSLNKENLDLHIKVTQIIWHHLGNGLYYENTKETIEELVLYGIYLYWTADSDFYKMQTDELDLIIRAIKGLKQLNIKYCIKLDNIILDNDEKKKIHRELEELINLAGGINILRRLFNQELKSKYDYRLERYLIHRDKSSYGKIKNKRIPYNYLIQICVKCLNPKITILTHQGIKEIYDKVIDISQNYMTVLNLQGYSIFEDTNININNITDYTYKNILFENMYIPVQYKTEIVICILEILYSKYFENISYRGYTFEQFVNVTKFILRKHHICKILNIYEVQKSTNLKIKIIKSILKDLSHESTKVNTEFNMIGEKVNFNEKPLIKIDEDNYFLLCPEMCSYSFCEVIYNILKAEIIGLDRLLGDSVELIVKEYLTKNSIEFKCGEYFSRDGIAEGECDLVLENDQFIVFIEIKKRSLPREFEIGDDVEVFKSLSEGMLVAQKQILNHRFHLIDNNKINLYDKEDKSKYEVLEWKNRRIIGISLCLPEYRFMTNKSFSSELLKSMLFVNYKTIDETKEEKLKKLNRLSSQIRDTFKEIQQIDSNLTAQNIFFNSLFMSIQQFIYTIGICSDKDKLIEYINKVTHITTGALDYYVDLINIKSL